MWGDGVVQTDFWVMLRHLHPGPRGGLLLREPYLQNLNVEELSMDANMVTADNERTSSGNVNEDGIVP